VPQLLPQPSIVKQQGIHSVPASSGIHRGRLNHPEADVHQHKFSMTLLSPQSFPSLYFFFFILSSVSFFPLSEGDKAAAAATGLTFLCA
jgi:hypothetical protein